MLHYVCGLSPYEWAGGEAVPGAEAVGGTLPQESRGLLPRPQAGVRHSDPLSPAAPAAALSYGNSLAVGRQELQTSAHCTSLSIRYRRYDRGLLFLELRSAPARAEERVRQPEGSAAPPGRRLLPRLRHLLHRAHRQPAPQPNLTGGHQRALAGQVILGKVQSPPQRLLPLPHPELPLPAARPAGPGAHQPLVLHAGIRPVSLGGDPTRTLATGPGLSAAAAHRHRSG